MSELRVIIGRESSEEEIDAVVAAFQSSKIEVVVEPSLVRMSADWQNLPMTIMVFAQMMAPNVLWDLMKYASVKIFRDARLKKRHSMAVVVKRKSHDIVISGGSIWMRTVDESREFSSFDDLLRYENSFNHSSSEENN